MHNKMESQSSRIEQAEENLRTQRWISN
jgi:hypothetical protein